MALSTFTHRFRRIARVPTGIGWNAVRRYGPDVATATGIPMSQQLTRLAMLRLRYGISSEDFFRYRMYRIPVRAAANFLSLPSNIARRKWLHERLAIDGWLLEDKRRCERFAASAGLPVPRTVAEFEGGEVRWPYGEGLPHRDLFAKEGAGGCGAGVARWDWAGDGRWRSPGGALVDEAAVIAELRAQSRSALMLLQERLVNHEALVPFGPAGLCTVRVITMRSPQDPTPEVLVTAFRMPTGDAVADNFAIGGLGCPVDVATGALGPARYKKLGLAHLDIATHPTSGATIVGTRLPLWDDVLALAIRAHRVFHMFPSVGWDIGITPDGPVLVEGNGRWDVVFAQQAGAVALGASRYVEHEREWMEHARRLHTRRAAPSAQPMPYAS